MNPSRRIFYSRVNSFYSWPFSTHYWFDRMFDHLEMLVVLIFITQFIALVRPAFRLLPVGRRMRGDVGLV